MRWLRSVVSEAAGTENGTSSTAYLRAHSAVTAPAQGSPRSPPPSPPPPGAPSPAVVGAEPRRELRHVAAGLAPHHVPRLAAPARGAPPLRPAVGRPAAHQAPPLPFPRPGWAHCGRHCHCPHRCSRCATRPAARQRGDYKSQHAPRHRLPSAPPRLAGSARRRACAEGRCAWRRLREARPG